MAMHRRLSGLLMTILIPAIALARDIQPDVENIVCVQANTPTQVVFPAKIKGGLKRRGTSLSLEREGRLLTIFAHPELSDRGETIRVLLENEVVCPLRIVLVVTSCDPPNESLRAADAE